jgi:predicted short-subunit dehydrogenase-like oxidoreductase (DUF2520 family)
MLNIEKVAIYGSGKVANYIAQRLNHKGIYVKNIISRNDNEGQKLARKIGAKFLADAETITLIDIDYVIICVSDQAIESVAKKLKTDGIIIHTSGATPLSILSDLTLSCGVIYPLQSINKMVDFANKTPVILWEANHQINESSIKKLAEIISDDCHEVATDKRLHYHIAAVFCNNFINHLAGLASDYLNAQNLNFELMLPLIHDTLLSIHANPHKSQTGPAVRFDEVTIQKHEQVLLANKSMLEMYQLLTTSIQKTKTTQ